jgi:methylphosphotriester-DNA--protein-cysteine methyltransferase
MRAAQRVVLVICLAAGAVLFAADAAIDAFPFTTVYITRPGRFYHRHSCIAIRNGRPIAISVSNAREQGFYPCRKCEPPTW